MPNPPENKTLLRARASVIEHFREKSGIRGERDSILDFVEAFLVRGIAGELDEKPLDEQALENARERCRRGNPFPLIAMQWPALLLHDPDEIELFEEDASPARMEGIPPSLMWAVIDPGNPPLRMSFWQKLILAAMFADDVSEIYIKGCTGAGKGASMGIGVNLLFDVYSAARIHLTSRDYNHALKNIFGEVSEWRQTMRYPMAGELLKESLSDSKRHYVSIVNPSVSGVTAGEAFSGAHGENTIYVFDEASAVPEVFVENAAKNARKIFALSNPRTMAGWFRAGFDGLTDINKTGVCYGTLGPRLCVTVGGLDCINTYGGRLKQPVAPREGIEIDGNFFGQGERIPDSFYERVRPLIPRQIDLTQFRSILNHPDPRHVDVFGHGKFPLEDPEKQLFLRSWFPRHEAAFDPDRTVTCYGFDAARSMDGDESCLMGGNDGGIRNIRLWQFADTVFHADEIIRLARLDGVDLLLGQNPVCIDMGGGYGGGVHDILRQRGVWVIGFVPNATSVVAPRLYANMRTEGYATLAERMDPTKQWKDQPFAVPVNERLKKELCAPERLFSKDMIRFGIEPKEQIKQDKLQGQSPDVADTAVYFFHAVRIYYNLNIIFSAAAFGSPVLSPLPQRDPTIYRKPEETNLLKWLRQRSAED